MNQDEKIPIASLKILEDTYNSKSNDSIHYSDANELYFAISQRVINALGLKIHKPSTDVSNNPSVSNYLHLLAAANDLRLRKIILKEGWHLFDNGPMVGFYDEQICALIPLAKGGYEWIDNHGKRQKITSNISKKIQGDAYVFYPSLPKENLTILTIVKFTLSAVKKDIFKVISCQLFSSIILLCVPIFSGNIFDNVIPENNVSLLMNFSLILLGVGFILMLIYFMQYTFLMRIKIKAQYKIQVGIWDRLLRLPLSFFKKLSVGDISYRCGVINNIQEELSTHVILTLIGGIMSVTNIGLMFFIDGYLACVAILLVMILSFVSLIFNYLILKQQRNLIKRQVSISSLLLNLVNAIAKIRAAHKEASAFQWWGEEFSEKLHSQIITNKYLNGISIFNIGFSGITTLIIYGLVIWRGISLSFGDFIIFNAAFIQFISSIIALTGVINHGIEIAPLFAITKPIFETPLEESETNKSKIDALDGHIVMKDIVFRYPGSEKPLFIDFNLDVKPGSFTAIVGPSGSGKSSIIRLLLGLEHPESGEIKFNGININNMQLHSLRSQIGVVMQTTQLIPGTLYENICGINYSMTREEAWEIASKVGLEQMIRDLPMGMDTLLNDGIQTFSGGEVQRINLARAISTKPKILLLDEATSALDNRNQYHIHQLLSELNITRVVIAHRLNTIVNADIIHVVVGGKRVESGSYEKLMAKKGAFFELSGGIK